MPHNPEAVREEIKRKLDAMVERFPRFRLFSPTMQQTADRALFRAEQCSLGKMVDTVRFLGEMEEMTMNLRFVNDLTREQRIDFGDMLGDLLDGTITRAVKEALVEHCGCRQA